jgi:hypothetical protein
MTDLTDFERESTAEGARILHRLVPAPDKGPGYRRDPETGFVYYSSEWLSDSRRPADEDRAGGRNTLTRFSDLDEAS